MAFIKNAKKPKGLHMEKPIIQGGMGIGVSRSRLAGAVAARRNQYKFGVAGI